MKTELQKIEELPITKNEVHQSELRSTAVLQYVLEMIQRGDSKETIFQTVAHLLNK